jgi:sensor c-di-GMP phosphodiesterase-like protein
MIHGDGIPRGARAEPGDKMPSRVATTIALAMCMLAVIVPIGAALYLAHRQSMAEASEQAVDLADEVLHRADTVGEQALAAYGRFRQMKAPAACSGVKRAQLRSLVMDYSYLQAVGYVSGDRIVCSAIGPRGDGVDLGPPTFVSALGTRIHTSVAVGGERPYLVMEKGG